MSTATGSQSHIYIFPEVALGTFPSGNFADVAFSSESFAGSINEIMSQEITNDRSAPPTRGGNITTGGGLNCDLGLSRFGILMAHLLGAAPTTTAITTATVADTTAYVVGDVVKSGTNDYLCVASGTTSASSAADLAASTTLNLLITSGTAQFVFFSATATAKKRHVFRGASSLLANGLAVEKAVLGGTDSTYIKFVGGRVNSLAIQVPQEGIIQAAWDMLFMGQFTTSGTSGAGTPVASAEEGPTGFQTVISINGTASALMKDGNFSISNDLDSDNFVIGSRTRHSITAKRRAISGSLTAMYDTDDLLTSFLNEESVALKFSFYNRNGFMSVEFPEVKLFGSSVPQIGGPGVITQSFSFKAFKSTGAYDVEVVMKNTTASYSV